VRVEESNRAEASTPIRQQQGLSPCCTSLAVKMVVHIRAKTNSYNFAIAFFVGLGSFTYGFDSAIVSSVIGLPSFYSYFNFEYTSSYGSSIIGANSAGGGAIGCWVVNWLSDKLGRRLAIQIIAAALPSGSDLVADGDVGTAHQARQVDVDRLVVRLFRVGPEVRP
jgi:hypothetical protein